MTESQQVTIQGHLLPDMLHDELGRKNPGLTVIHAGHYMLHVKGGVARDYLDGEGHGKAFQEIMEFSQSTWRLACDSVRLLSGTGQTQLMVLVNDWQYLIPSDLPQRERQKRAAVLRQLYFSEVSQLPAFHMNALAEREMHSDYIFKSTEQTWLFSESLLRERLSGTLSELMKDQVHATELGLTQHFTKEGHPIVHADSDNGRQICLSYCGGTNCAGEIIQLIKELSERGVRRFINLYPLQCMEPVETGTGLAHRLFGLSGMRIVNVAISHMSIHSPVHVSRTTCL